MRWRFMAVVMAITALVMLVQLIPLAQYLQLVEREHLTTSLERDAFVLAGRAEEALESGTPAEIASVDGVARDYRQAGGARVVIVDSLGIAIVTSDDDQSRVGGDYSTRPEIADALAGTIATGSRFSTTLDEHLVYVAVPVISGEDIVGAVRLTYPAAVIDETVGDRLQVIGVVALITVLVAGLAGVVFSTSVTRRLRGLTETSERIADGDLTARADPEGGAPEIRTLSRSFNRMADRVSSLLTQQRAFAADASHQLRTPLTALRLKLERARELIDHDPAAAAQRLGAAEVETERLVTIIEGLLALSRAEARDDTVIDVDLSRVAAERVEQWSPLAAELGVTVEFRCPAEVTVKAIPSSVDQIIDNLVDNALEVSTAGSTVTVDVGAGLEPYLRILDQGPGMSDSELARAFDRFWRAPAAPAGGTGLGLAVVAELVRASGARITLARRDEGGLEATVVFRASRRAPEER